MIFLHFTVAPTAKWTTAQQEPNEQTTAGVMVEEDDVRKCIPRIVDFFKKQGLKILTLNEARLGYTPADFTFDERVEQLYAEAAERGIACRFDAATTDDRVSAV
jgi:glycine cleavage system regulatory protein